MRDFDIYGIIHPLMDAMVRASFRKPEEIEVVKKKLTETGMTDEELQFCYDFLDRAVHLDEDRHD